MDHLSIRSVQSNLLLCENSNFESLKITTALKDGEYVGKGERKRLMVIFIVAAFQEALDIVMLCHITNSIFYDFWVLYALR